MKAIVVKRGRANPLWHGHPWLFSGAVEREEGAPQPGDVVDVKDGEGRFIGRGHYNGRSQIRVRVVTMVDEAIDADFFARRLGDALALRRRLGLPSEETTAYRLINAEGDFLPGVIVDVYGDVVCVQFTSLGMKQMEALVFDAVDKLLAPRALVEIGTSGVTEIEGFHAATRVVRGSLDKVTTCRENGLQLEVDPLGGQKTGLFLDQRDNRRRVAELARGARVLDVYCYAGGFGLAALRAGASSVTCVDASAPALKRAERHAELNGLKGLDAVESDAFRFLETATPRRYDLVVLDPPKFARAKKDLAAALKAYQRLNVLGLTTVAAGGLLATASCSQHVDEESFERMLAGAARDAGRRLSVLERRSAGADHPLPPGFAEGRYLTFLLCRVS